MAQDGLFTPTGFTSPEEIRRRIGVVSSDKATAFGISQANLYQDPNKRIAAQIGGAFGAGLAGGYTGAGQAEVEIAEQDKARAKQAMRMQLLSSVDTTDRVGGMKTAQQLLALGDTEGAKFVMQSLVKSDKPIGEQDIVNLMSPEGLQQSYRKGDIELDNRLKEGWTEISKSVQASNISELTKKGTGAAETAILDSADTIARLEEIGENFEAGFLTYGEQVKQGFLHFKGKLGFELSDEQIESRERYTNFTMGVRNNLNLYIKQITGAAMSVQEAKRIMKAMPTLEDDPAKFRQGVNTILRQAKAAMSRYQYALDNGISAVTSEKSGTMYFQDGKFISLSRFYKKGNTTFERLPDTEPVDNEEAAYQAYKQNRLRGN